MNTSNTAPLGTEHEGLNGVSPLGDFNFATASGIDSVYYFIQSNADYKEFFHYEVFSKVEQAREEHGGFIPKRSLKISISDVSFVYFGKEQGFYFFGDEAGAFRVGFKDPSTNQGVHDIRVQLQGLGIYALGVVRLLEYVNGTVLKDISTLNYFITRADLNIFCQYDLGSLIEPQCIVTRKRSYTQIIGNKKRYETLYVGKPPALLRVYNKFIETNTGSGKFYFLKMYLEEHGIEFKNPLWNFEIELHRDYLKQYKISTLDDLLTNAEMLFQKFMEQVRLIDIVAVYESEGRSANHPLWDYLKQSYRFNAIEQKTVPLERIEYAPKELTANDFIEEFRTLVEKYVEHSVTINQDEVREVLHESQLWLTHKAKKRVKPFIPVIYQSGKLNYLLTRNFTAVPTLPKSLEHIDDTKLNELAELLAKALHQELSKEDQDIALIVKHTQAINMEKERRRAGQKELELWHK